MKRKIGLITGLVLAGLVLAGCSSNDPLVTAEANRRNADAERQRAETQIKVENWQLERDQKQSAADRQKAKDELQKNLDAVYGPAEREEDLKRQWVAFWTGVVVLGGLAILGAIIVVDRYRLSKREIVKSVEEQALQERERLNTIKAEIRQATAELATYEVRSRQELSNVRKAQRELTDTQVKVEEAKRVLKQTEEEFAHLCLLVQQERAKLKRFGISGTRFGRGTSTTFLPRTPGDQPGGNGEGKNANLSDLPTAD